MCNRSISQLLINHAICYSLESKIQEGIIEFCLGTATLTYHRYSSFNFSLSLRLR